MFYLLFEYEYNQQPMSLQLHSWITQLRFYGTPQLTGYVLYNIEHAIKIHCL